MEGTLLEVVYNLNETRGKRVSVGLDPLENFEPNIYLYKQGVARAKLTEDEWMTLLSLKEEIEDFFKKDILVRQEFTVSHNVTVSLLESHHNRLVCIEYFVWPVLPTNTPKSVVKLWLNDKQWNSLLKLRECIEATYQHYKSCVPEVRTLFERFASSLNTECGHELRRRYGDITVIEEAMNHVNIESLLYVSDHGLDVRRTLFELRVFCLEQLRDYVKYNPTTMTSLTI